MKDKITSVEIREIFLDFFQRKEHLKISGSSIIPDNDPTLLFINSGMAPLKKYFTGEAEPPGKKLCNIQPCIRTIDIEETGDRHHLTSFEMLGSWGINDYFKKEAITFAYELLTEGYKIPKEKLYVTFFSGDEDLNLKPDTESAEIWESLGMAKDHIVPQPFEDNFWGPAGEIGPCGPCTEVFYDTGDEYGAQYKPGDEFDTKHRYIEIWNAGVFMEFNKISEGRFENLKFKSVDTGAGLERLTMTLNGYHSVYDIELLRPIIDEIKNQSRNLSALKDKTIKVLTDHLRTVAFITSEGIYPSNEGRGYILRRLIRRCVALIIKDNNEDISLNVIMKKVIQQYGDFYPHIKDKQEIIYNTLEQEVAQFKKVVKEGIKKIDKICRGSSTVINGKDAFLLVSTYGMPIDLVVEFAEEKNYTVDIEAFKEIFNEHQIISRQSKKKEDSKLGINDKTKALVEDINATEFVGYEQYATDSTIVRVIKDNKVVDTITEGDKGILVCLKSPFYAESGGQVADTGIVITNKGQFKVDTVIKTNENVFLHIGTVEKGSLNVNDSVKMNIEQARRHRIAYSHSSVHLLQSVLRDVLGDSIKQSGSFVEDERIRFDFSYDAKISQKQLNEIEMKVNAHIQENLPLNTYETSYEKAIEDKVLAFFESKYDDQVRVVKFGDISAELCGGTHTSQTGNIGYFKIISEESVGRGISRINALVGSKSTQYIQDHFNKLLHISSLLKTSVNDIEKRIESLQNSKKAKSLEVKIESMSSEQINSMKRQATNGIYYVYNEYPEFSNQLKDEATRISKMIGGIVCFVVTEMDQIKVLVAVDKPLTDTIQAGTVLNKLLSYVDGKGGGRPNLAMGAGKNKSNMTEIQENLEKVIVRD